MEKISQCVYGSEMLSLLDGFSCYNQVLVSHDDKMKASFQTKWGTYAYRKIPFGMINMVGKPSKEQWTSLLEA
jgi:hypothetical protein